MRLGIWKTEGVPDAIHASGIIPYLRFVFGADFVSARALCDPVCAGETATDCACFCPLFSV
jgi:hypothetical protein